MLYKLIFLAIVNQFDSLEVRFVSNWPFGYSFAVTYDTLRKIAYIASGGGVYTMDVSNSNSPNKLSEKIRTRGFIHNLYYDHTNQDLYIVGEIIGMEIWDVSNPYNPNKLGHFPPYGTFYGIDKKGNHVYVTEEIEMGRNRLLVIDVSNTSSPNRIALLTLPHRGSAIKIFGNFAYVAAWDSGLRIIDISNPYSPQQVGHYMVGTANSVDVFDRYAYVINQRHGSLYIIDVSNPGSPVCVSAVGDAGKFNVKISGNYAYALRDRGLTIIDVTNPSSPRVVGRWNIPSEGGCGIGLSVFGSYVYLTTAPMWWMVMNTKQNERFGFYIINITNPSSPVFSGYYPLPGGTIGIDVVDTFAYIVSEGGLFYILNTANINSPYKVGYCFTRSNSPRDVLISGSYAYVADYDKGLSIIDISNINSPNLVASYNPGAGHSSAIDIKDTLAYIANGAEGMYIVNISNPSIPRVVGSYNTQGFANDISVSDSYAYIANGDELKIINVANPSNPYEVSNLPSEELTIGVVSLKDRYAYIVDKGGSYSLFRIIDISNPISPVERGRSVLPGPLYFVGEITVVDSFAYIIGGPEEIIYILNVANPANILLVGRYNFPPPISIRFAGLDVDYSSPYIYVADRYCGVQIYRNLLVGVEEKKEKLPSTIDLLNNPIHNNLLKIKISIPYRKEMKFSIYNIAGELVKEYSKIVEPTDQYIQFDVKELSSGIYFLKIDEINKSEKFLIIKGKPND